MARRALSVGFSLTPEDNARLERLVSRFGHGSRSIFLRVALDTMEAVDRAERLRSLQAYGVQQTATRGLGEEDVDAVVKRVLGTV